MVTRATVFTTVDGQHFPTVELARAHEKSLLIGSTLRDALLAAGLADAVVVINGQPEPVELEQLLLTHAESLVVALTPPKKERKKREPKVPVVTETPIAEVVVAAAAAEAAAEAAPAVEVTPVVESGEDELAALLGGESVV